jgi:hypothetical protein
MIRALLAIALLVAAVTGAGAQGRRRSQQNAEAEKTEDLSKISGLLERLSLQPALTPENRFLHDSVARLLDRSRSAAAGSYLFDRLESAMDDLLEASEQILESSDAERGRREDREDASEARQRTARELERSYFRILQGDYFASQSRESNGPEYVQVSRRIYQQARAAYDAGDYRRARTLAEAARSVIEGLESLAQAAVPIPEPPTLPGG